MAQVESAHPKQAASDTVHFLFDQQKAKRMERMKSFASKITSHYRRYEQLSPKQARRLREPINEGWLSMKSLWRGGKEALRFPLLIYGGGADDTKYMLLFFAQEEARPCPTLQRSYLSPADYYSKHRSEFRYPKNEQTPKVCIIIRDAHGQEYQLPLYRMRVYTFEYGRHRLVPHILSSYAYHKLNIFAFDSSLSAEEETDEAVAADRRDYQALLREGFLSRDEPLVYRLPYTPAD